MPILAARLLGGLVMLLLTHTKVNAKPLIGTGYYCVHLQTMQH